MTRLLKLFHGTTIARVNVIKKIGFQFKKKEGYLAFGDGCYFYLESTKAERFARDLHGDDDAAVVEVEVVVSDKHIKKMARYELDEGAAKINERALYEQWHVIDASTDDDIVVVRPDATQLIRIVHSWQANLSKRSV